MDTSLSYRKRSYGYDNYPFQKPDPVKLDDSSPAEVRQRAKERIESLKRSIKEAKERIAREEAELAEWEKILK